MQPAAALPALPHHHHLHSLKEEEEEGSYPSPSPSECPHQSRCNLSRRIDCNQSPTLECVDDDVELIILRFLMINITSMNLCSCNLLNISPHATFNLCCEKTKVESQ